MVIDTSGEWDLRYGHFLCFLESKMVKFGLYFKKVAKMANFRPNLVQDANFALILNGHNLASLSDFDVRARQND